MRDDAFATSDIGPLSPAHFLFPSRIVSLDPDIRDYIRQSFPPGRAILDAAIELIDRIKSDLVYEIGATTVTTTPPMSLRAAPRRLPGFRPCHDFRAARHRPAGRLCRGYLRTVSLTDRPRLQGADAMHAWVMLWCGPDVGWIGLDPTNAVLASDAHVMLAIGRDYTDVAPMDGVIFGSGGQRIAVSVNVIPVG